MNRFYSRNGLTRRAIAMQAPKTLIQCLIPLLILIGFPGLKDDAGLTADTDYTRTAGMVDGNLEATSYGSLRYQIPLKVAPGVKDLTPALSLAYDSANLSNGILGVGWQLNGLSSIERCGQKYYLDQKKTSVSLSNEDRLCKDGKRLIAKQTVSTEERDKNKLYWNSKNHYFTEVEEWSRTSVSDSCAGVNGPCGFISRLRNGNILYYGGDAKARVMGANKKVTTWLLSKIEDPYGNIITITYKRALFHIVGVPDEIKYNNRKIKFNYKTVSEHQDHLFGYLGGGPFHLQQKMTGLELYTGDTLYKKYVFDYAVGFSGRSLLTSLSECDAENVCLDATKFDYSKGNTEGRFQTPVKPEGDDFNNRLNGDFRYLLAGDFNGDGKEDFLNVPRRWTSNYGFKIFLSEDAGKFSVHTPRSDNHSDYYSMELKHALLHLGDFNGDGKTDFIRQDRDEMDTHVYKDFGVYLSNGDGTFNISRPDGDEYQKRTREPEALLIAGDVDGDGKTDLIRFGKRDRGNENFNVFFSNGTGGFKAVTPGGDKYQKNLLINKHRLIITPGDFNGDGRIDFIRQLKKRAFGKPTGPIFQVYLSKGDGTFEIKSQTGEEYQDWLWGPNPDLSPITERGAELLPGDFNGDGLTDFLRRKVKDARVSDNNNFNIYYSRGDGTFSVFTPEGDEYQEDLRAHGDNELIISDFNGDGKSDFIRVGKDTNKRFRIYYSTGWESFDIKTPSNDVYQKDIRKGDVILTPGDFNGDGLADFIRMPAEDDEDLKSFNIYFNNSNGKGEPNSNRPELLKEVQEGNNKKIEVSYKRMLDLYTGAAPEYPLEAIEYRGTNWLVEKITTQDLVTAKKNTSSYSYKGALLGREGRGFMGFTTVEITHPEHELKEEVYYNAEFRLRGKKSAVTVTALALDTNTLKKDRVIKGETFVWEEKPGAAGTNSQINLSIRNTTFYYDGLPRTTRSQMIYDDYGNITAVIDYKNETDTALTSCLNWINKEDQWTLGRLTRERTGPNCTYAKGVCSCTGDILTDNNYAYKPGHLFQLHEKSIWDSSTNGSITTTYHEYDTYGNPKVIYREGKEIGGKHKTITYEYETEYNTYPIKVTEKGYDGLTLETTYKFDPATGEKIKTVDANGAVLRQELDSFGRLKAVYVPDNEGKEFKRESRRYYRHTENKVSKDSSSSGKGNMVTEVTAYLDWNGKKQVTQMYMDGLGRLVKREKNGPEADSWIVEDSVWNARGLLAMESNPYLQKGDEDVSPVWNVYKYDEHGRRKTMDHFHNTRTEFTYKMQDANCNASQLAVTLKTFHIGATNARSRTNCYDYKDRLSKEILGSGDMQLVRTYERNGLGKIKKVSDDSGLYSSFTHSSIGKVMSSNSAQTRYEEYEYNQDGSLKAVYLDPDKKQLDLNFLYDGLSRITHKIFSDGSRIEYEYDSKILKNSKGRLSSISQYDADRNRLARREYSYDLRGNISTMKLIMPEGQWLMAYEYYPDNSLWKITYPDNSVQERVYNAAGFLEKVLMDNVAYVSYSNYNAKGQPGKIENLNGSNIVYEYDKYQRLDTYKLNGKNKNQGDVQLESLKYRWNAYNEIREINDWRVPRRTKKFKYNDLGYLKEMSMNNQQWTYEYYANGDIKKKNGVTFTYENNRLKSADDGLNLTYDKNGAVLSKSHKGNIWEYKYDENRNLVEVQQNYNLVASYVYDGNSRRVKKTDANGIVSIYVSPVFVVTRYKQGKVLQTKYLDGISKRVAAITDSTVSTALMQYNRHVLQAKMYNMGSLQGLWAGFNNSVSMFLSKPNGYGRIILKYPLLMLIGLSLLLLFIVIWFQDAKEQSEFVREHRAKSLAVPGLIFCLLTFQVFHCHGDSGHEIRLTLNNLLGNNPAALTSGMDTGLGAGENGRGYPENGLRYFHNNHVGSTNVVTDEMGRQISRLYYSPFGEILSGESKGRDGFRSKYAGQELGKNTGLYYFNSRYYDPSLGRFIQPDKEPMGSNAFMASDLNRYVYGANNPILYNDPSGKLIFVFKLIVVAIVSAVISSALYTVTALAKGTFNLSKFFISFGMGAFFGALGFGAGAFFTKVLSKIIEQTTLIAHMAVSMVSSTLSGALTGFVSGIMNQIIAYGKVRDWAKVAVGMGQSAGIGLVVGAAAGYVKHHGAVHKKFIRKNLERTAKTNRSMGAGQGSQGVLLKDGFKRFKYRKEALAETHRPLRSIYKKLTKNDFARKQALASQSVSNRNYGTILGTNNLQSLQGFSRAWKVMPYLQDRVHFFGLPSWINNAAGRNKVLTR